MSNMVYLSYMKGLTQAVMGSHFLESLLKVSEKAANIARVCRQDQHLFKLLVQEKTGDAKNPRFVQDFKTLSDVLIQETVKHDIGNKFGEIAAHIYGEETNEFVNTLGEHITVRVEEDEEHTAELLSQVLGGDSTAAQLLAAEVHRNVTLDELCLTDDQEETIPSSLKLPLDQLGLWIDPIDSTAEYISGEELLSAVSSIHKSGLRCVTVLIGVFDLQTGCPVAGVVNQPFHCQEDGRWRGKCEWAVNFQQQRFCSVPSSYLHDDAHKVVVLSSNESPALKSQLSLAGYRVAEAAGAGYKQLCVVQGLAAAYVLTKGSTFYWDTCGPHALLSAGGGKLLSYQAALLGKESEEVVYEPQSKIPGARCCHQGGLVAVREANVLPELLEALRQSRM